MHMPQEKQNTSTLIFDLGGVLIDWNPRYLYRKLFDDEVELEYFLTEVCSLAWNAEMDAGKPFATAIAERIQIYPTYAPYIRSYQERWLEMIRGDIPGTVHILSQLRQAGHPLYALSNWSAETFPLAEEKFGFLHWFQEIVLSGKEKQIKPNAAIYQTLLARIGKEAEACIFIDDSLVNVQAAQQLGFDAIHFHSPTQLGYALQERGYGVIDRQ